MATKAETQLLRKLDDNFKSAVENPAWVDYGRNGTNDFDFVENRQWTAKEITELKNRGQAATVENEIHPIVERVKGQHKKQKTRIIYRGRNQVETEEGTDENRGNIWSDLFLHAQQRSGYEFEEGDMFDDGTKSGFGVLEVKIDLDDVMSPAVKISHDSCFDTFPDANSRHYDWNEDAEHISRAKWMSLKKAKALYPGKASQLKKLINVNPIDSNETQTLEGYNYTDDRTKRVRLVEQWYKTYKKRASAITNEGVVDITDYSRKERRAIAKTGLVIEKVVTKMKMAVFCKDVLLEAKDSPYDHNFFPWVPYFCYRKKNGEPYSFVRLLKDSNMEINKRRSKALHLLNTNQAVFEEGAIRNLDELKKQMAKPDGLIEYRKDYEFEIMKNIEVAASQMQFQQESKSAMPRISGIPDESMARHSEIRSGIGLQRKQMMGDIITHPLFDNLRRTRLMVGRIGLALMKQYYTEEKVFHVTDDMNKARQVKLQTDDIEAAKTIEFDIIVEEMPDTTTIQDEQFRMIGETLQSMNLPPNYAMALLPIWLQSSTLRNKEEIMKQVQALSEPAPEHPKMSLNLVWSELQPEEKSVFAKMMGLEDLSAWEIEEGGPPAHVVKEEAGVLKAGLKAETDSEKTETASETALAVAVISKKEEKKDGKRNKAKT